MIKITSKINEKGYVIRGRKLIIDKYGSSLTKEELSKIGRNNPQLNELFIRNNYVDVDIHQTSSPCA